MYSRQLFPFGRFGLCQRGTPGNTFSVHFSHLKFISYFTEHCLVLSIAILCCFNDIWANLVYLPYSVKKQKATFERLNSSECEYFTPEDKQF